ncbi:unnamed protein product [Effrenium voratum]|nr:unnamed protein product [Effrenium voratum]
MDHAEEARRVNSRGANLLQELIAALQRRDGPGVSNDKKHRISAEDVEPIFELLQEVLLDTSRVAEESHLAARRAAEAGEASSSAFLAADALEQDAQLKEQLVSVLTHASDAEQAISVQVMWNCRPWLQALDGLGARPARAQR